MSTYAFGPFELDARQRRLMRDGSLVALSDRHVRVLLHLVAQAGSVVSKDALVAAAWDDVAVTDNSLEQAISSIRRTLGVDAQGLTQVETVPRQGYRFTGAVTRTASRESDIEIDALMAPHRAWLEGRAALETLKRDNIVIARAAFERALSQLPDLASAHVGLANAAVMEFEATRADLQPNLESLRTAVHHAQEACRLDPAMGEGWATLGFVLARVDRPDDALAAARRAVGLEPDNWRHQFRLASIAWGEERLRAAKRTLRFVNGFGLAHYLAATVHVARQAFDDAERELRAGIAAESMAEGSTTFGSVALHWLLGLILLARGDENAALEQFELELARESRGHLYTREVCAAAYYAIGTVHFLNDRLREAKLALEQSLVRRPTHALARLVMTELRRRGGSVSDDAPIFASDGTTPDDQILASAATSHLEGRPKDGADAIDKALQSAPSGSNFWQLPVEPLLRTSSQPRVWSAPLSRIRARAT